MIEIRQDQEKYLGVSITTLDEITNKMIKEPDFGKLELMLLLRIASFSWTQNGTRNLCRKSISVFQEEFERSRQTIERSLKKLRRLGYVQHVYRIMLKGGKEENTVNWKEAKRWEKRGGKMLNAHYKVTITGLGDKIRPLSKSNIGLGVKNKKKHARPLSKSDIGNTKKHIEKHVLKHMCKRVPKHEKHI